MASAGQDFDRTLYTLRQLRKPSFAAVNGIAYGGGSELAQSTDFIIAFDSATFGHPEAMIGLAAGGGSPALLPECSHREGASDADDGGPITAQEAYRLGMVNESDRHQSRVLQSRRTHPLPHQVDGAESTFWLQLREPIHAGLAHTRLGRPSISSVYGDRSSLVLCVQFELDRGGFCLYQDTMSQCS
jgi:hypothetical protein